jgi:hypothetical protein
MYIRDVNIHSIHHSGYPRLNPVDRIRGRNIYILTRSVSYYYVYSYKDLTQVLSCYVRAGLVVDGCSYPRAVWSLLGVTPDGLNRAAGVIHDALYRSRGRSSEDIRIWTERGRFDTHVSRKVADKIFLAELEKTHKYKWVDKLSYGVLRAFGGLHWGGPNPALK